jgi:hypothetical protein
MAGKYYRNGRIQAVFPDYCMKTGTEPRRKTALNQMALNEKFEGLTNSQANAVVKGQPGFTCVGAHTGTKHACGSADVYQKPVEAPEAPKPGGKHWGKGEQIRTAVAELYQGLEGRWSVKDHPIPKGDAIVLPTDLETMPGRFVAYLGGRGVPSVDISGRPRPPICYRALRYSKPETIAPNFGDPSNDHAAERKEQSFSFEQTVGDALEPLRPFLKLPIATFAAAVLKCQWGLNEVVERVDSVCKAACTKFVKVFETECAKLFCTLFKTNRTKVCQ